MKTTHIIFCLICLLFGSCEFNDTENVVDSHRQDSISNANNSTPITEPTKPRRKEYLSADAKVQKMVMTLPEVKKICAAIDSIHKTKNNVESVIEQNPSDDDPYYSIVIKDKNAKDESQLLQFFVDPGTNQIKVYDPGEDRLIPLAEWRKMQIQ